MPRPSRLGLALVAAVAASSLFVGGGVALAVDPPVPGSSECTSKVNEDQTVKDAQTALDAKPGDADLTTKLNDAKTAATAKLCTGKKTTTTSPTTTTTSKAPGGGNNGGNNDSRGGNGGGRGGDRDNDGRDDDDQDGPGDDKDCDDFMSQREAQAYYDGAKRPGDDDPSQLDKDDDGKACESLADVDGDRSKLPARIDVNVVIVQTDDDDSEAKVSGSQVKDVPQGSVDTGSAQ